MKNVILILMLCSFVSYSTSSKSNLKPLNLAKDSLVPSIEDSLSIELDKTTTYLIELTDTLKSQQKTLKNAN